MATAMNRRVQWEDWVVDKLLEMAWFRAALKRSGVIQTSVSAIGQRPIVEIHFGFGRWTFWSRIWLPITQSWAHFRKERDS